LCNFRTEDYNKILKTKNTYQRQLAHMLSICVYMAKYNCIVNRLFPVTSATFLIFGIHADCQHVYI
jgi:hypothetical protein